MASKKRRRRQQTRKVPAGAPRPPAGTPDEAAAPSGPDRADVPEPSRGARHAVVPAVVAALTFVISFVLYLVTLAPTVTFEDSGELAAAAYNLGVPHEPGYPLWTMLGWAFTHLPIGDVAYRLNLMSAFFSALGAALVALAVLVVAGRASRQAGRSGGDGVVACGAAVAAGMLCATAQSTWEQSLITEVYGLNTFFVGLLLVLLAVYGRSASSTTRRNAWWAVCLTLGLALTNHPTVVLLIPVALVWMLVLNYRPAERALRLGAGRLALGAAWFAAGLLPLLYLPLASRRDPVLDWGDPETWTTFRRVVTRHQYGSGPASGLHAMAHEVWAYFGLLWDQWFPLLLALVAVGLVALWLHHRRFFWLALALWIATGPVTTIVTDFPVDTASAQANAENRALVSVFYIPSYMVLAFVAGVGLAGLLGLAARRLAKGDGRRPAVALPLSAVVVVALVLAAIPTYRAVDMSGYRFAQAYVHNVLDTASPDSLVMGDRDQFVFPLMYAQMVDGRRPDVVVLDQELLRRSWYIEMLRHDQPALMAAVKPQADAFVAAVAPFEKGEAYDGAAIDAAYYGLIKALVDQYEKNGRDVYFTYAPPDVIAQDYRGEPLGAAWRTRTTPPGKTPTKIANWLTPVDPSIYDFSGLTAGEQRLDRNALLIRRYYGELLGARAQLLAQAGETEEAARLQALAQQFVAQE
jgi:hypothetical protein